MIVSMPYWNQSITTIRPSAFTNNGSGTASNPANAYDGSTSTAATLSSLGVNETVDYKTFPTLTLPNAGTLTIRRTSTTSKVSLETSKTRLWVSFNSGSSWTSIEVLTGSGSSTVVGPSDVTYTIPSGTTMGTVWVRCEADTSSGATVDSSLDVYDIRVEY